MEKINWNNSGFTLIELILVICIMAIIAGISTPEISRKVRDYRMSAAVRDLQSEIQSARINAIKEGATVGINFDLGTNKCTTFLDNGTTQGAWDAGDTVLSTMVMPDGVDMYALASGGTVLGFSGRGTLSFPLATETIELKNSDNLYRGVSIRITGNSVIVRSADNGATWL